MTEHLPAGARALAAAVRCREITANDVVERYLETIERLDPLVQAWEYVDESGARAAAKLIDELLADGDSAAPLLGVPVGIKDVLTARGVPTGFGTEIFRGRGVRQDAVAVARLRRAGAIVLGKTVTCTFAGPDPARTVNPWHADRTPGGSSAGSAAAVASGMVPIAVGTQTAGSVLRPAAFCGVVGFKPTFGRVSCEGVFPFAPSLDTVGWFATSAADVELIFAALTETPADAYAPLEDATPALREIGLRAAHLTVSEPLSPAVAQHEERITARLADLGVDIVEARLPFALETLWAAQYLITHAEAAGVHSRLVSEHPQAYGPGLRAMVELGHAVPGWSYAQARTTQRLFAELVDEYLARFDLLILPTVGEAAPDRTTTGRHPLQSIATFLGLPAIALPTGFDDSGLPLSTQLVGRRGRDEQLLRHARLIEAALGLTWRRAGTLAGRHA